MGNWSSTLWEPVRGWRKLRIAPMKVWRSWGAPLPYWIRVPPWHFLPALCRLSTIQGERAALRQRKWSAWVTNLSVSTRTVLHIKYCWLFRWGEDWDVAGGVALLMPLWTLRRGVSMEWWDKSWVEAKSERRDEELGTGSTDESFEQVYWKGKQRSKAEGEERRAVKVVSETIIKKGEMIGGFYADGADPRERGKQA